MCGGFEWESLILVDLVVWGAVLGSFFLMWWFFGCGAGWFAGEADLVMWYESIFRSEGVARVV